MSVIKCQQCSSENVSFEPFRTVQIPIPESKGLNFFFVPFDPTLEIIKFEINLNNITVNLTVSQMED